MKKCVRIYIEGGGGKAGEGEKGINSSDFRRCWRKFLGELDKLARDNGYDKLEVVRGGGRSEAFRRFTKYEVEHPHDLCVLLVDSETSVAEGERMWDVVGRREGDRWQRPEWATEEHLYLMVHTVEAWLVADPEALGKFFGKGFDQRHLPTTNIEDRAGEDVDRALKKATQGSRKGPYRHGQAHEIIEIVRPEMVKSLQHGRRLFDSLSSLIRKSKQ